MAKKIYLSPSNQYANTYATGGTNEMAQCDKIAKAASTALTRCGFSVKVGKSGDSMANRCAESNAFKADIHMPIHTNATAKHNVTGGTRIFCYSSKNKPVCDAVLKYLGAISPGKGDSVSYRTDLYEINVPNAVTVYLECEFHDTKTGSDWIRNNINAIGEAIAKGMCDYFGVKYKAPTSSTNPKPSTPTKDEDAEVEKIQVTMQKLFKGNNANRKGQVLTLQRILNELKEGSGYRGKDGKKLTLDGEFGENTEYALKEYQKVHGLTVDGICGQADWNKILCYVP